MTNEAIRKRDIGLDKSLNKKLGLLIDKIAKGQRPLMPPLTVVRRVGGLEIK